MSNSNRRILEDVIKQFGDTSQIKKHSQKRIDLTRNLLRPQKDLLLDSAPRKAALCSRRSGKSFAAAYALVRAAYENPDTTAAYMALTRLSAKNTLWKALENINYRYSLEMEPNLTELTWSLPNGSKILLTGADRPHEIDKLRGQGFIIAVIDEAASLGNHLSNLVLDVLEPALGTYKGSQIILIGTPGIIPTGLFYDITTGALPEWSVHKWNITDNLELPRWAGEEDWKEQAELYLEEVLRKNNWTRSTPTFVREYLGEWCSDATDRVTKFEYGRNTFIELPKEEEFNFLIGIDFGIVDATAITVGAYCKNSPDLFIVESFKQSYLTPEEVAHRIKHYWDLYHPVGIVADSGGIGKAFLAQVQAMYSMPIRAAEKKDKVGFIELMNDDFVSGKIKVQRGLNDLISELTELCWKDSVRRILPDQAQDHCFDSLLYLWRESRHWLYSQPEKQPEVGSYAWEVARAEEWVEKQRIKHEQPWWSRLDSW